ncbi:MAG: xylulokinase, partial [Actinomycetota bacterium]|nr:xylulokinase [Actinomycetota bacterium]
VPAATELVALGAAVQAAALLEASPSDAVARRWRTREGESLAALRRDDELCGRLARWCATVSAPLRPGGPAEG